MQILSRGLAGVGLGPSHPATPLQTQALAPLPANLLDSFIPGYSTISSFVLDALGFDITLFVSVSFVGYALVKAVNFIKQQATALIFRYATCSVNISSDVDSYSWIMEWLANRGIGPQANTLTALPGSEAFSLKEMFTRRFNPEGPPPPPPRKGNPEQKYEPALGLSHYFWHRGHFYLWYRMREKRQLTDSGLDIPTTVIMGTLYCLGRSTAPLKALIEEASALNHEKTAVKTVIRRPAPKNQRRDGMNPWKKAATRPSRSIKTVVLEETQKQAVIRDVEEYLLPETCAWYAQRGIPYRRGYLFYGPPGTGKTSLSFAIAGVFGLEVYCISLQEPTITEEDLVTLFEKLPEQCLVLLEDVDTAGLVVREKATVTRDPTTDEPKADTRISLSGLLNILDGVASQEGRVLVMTTNHIEHLDNALLRPGRIDLRVQFELATRAHAEDLFIQLFATDPISSEKQDEESRASESETAHNLEAMAKAFAEQIPEKELSPAEIQGFLINWKKSPSDAVANATTWVAETLASSNRG